MSRAESAPRRVERSIGSNPASILKAVGAVELEPFARIGKPSLYRPERFD